MGLSINHYACPNCGRPVEPWLARRPRFECPGCASGYRSNYRHSLKRSALAGLLLWLGGMLLGMLLIDPWQMVLAFSLELGGFIAFGLAWLWHHHSIAIESCPEVPEASGSSAGAPAFKDPPG